MSVRGGRVEPELSIWVLAAVTLGLLVSCGDYRHAKDEPFVFVDELSVAELSFEPSQLRSVGHFEQASAPVTLTTATSIVDTRRSLISLVPGRI